MNFLSFKDKLEDFKCSYTTSDKLINGARMFGTVLANTAIAAGKVTAQLPAQIEKQKGKK